MHEGLKPVLAGLRPLFTCVSGTSCGKEFTEERGFLPWREQRITLSYGEFFGGELRRLRGGGDGDEREEGTGSFGGSSVIICASRGEF